MAMLRFMLKRFAAQRLLGLAVVVTLAFSVGVLVAGPIYADAAREAILSSTLQGVTVSVANARFQVYGDADFDWEAADAAIATQLQPIPVRTVVRQGLATVRLGGEDGPSVPLLFREGAEDNLTFTGDAPGPGQVAIVKDSSQTAGIRIGDRVTVLGPTGKELELTVSGTYAPPDAGDPFWFGSQTPFPAPDSTQAKPIIVSLDTGVAASRHLRLTTEFAWDAYLALDGVPFVEARTIPGELRHIAGELQAQPGLQGIRMASGLDTLFDIVQQRVENLRIPILLVVFQIGAVTLAVLAGVGALTLTRQAFELSVLHSRGFSRRALLLGQAVQAVFAAVVAYPLGLAIGLALATLASHSNGPTLPGVLFPIRLNGAAVDPGGDRGRDRRRDPASAFPPLPLANGLGGTARRVPRGTPAPFPDPCGTGDPACRALRVRSAAGGTKPKAGSGAIEPLVLLAPTLLLFAASFLALRLLLFVFRRMDGWIGRTRRLPVYLAGRKLSRAPGAGFAAALLLLLSMGLLVVSTSYRAIVLRNHRDAAHTLVGADWNVQVAPPEDVLRAMQQMPAGTTPVIRTEPDLRQGSFSIPPAAIAIDPATYAQGGWWREDFSDTPIETILADLRTAPLGLDLTPGASTLNLSLDVPPAAAGLGLSATVLDADGVAHTAPPVTIETGPATYGVPLAPGTRILSITLQAESSLDLPFRFAIGIDDAQIDGVPLALDGWEPLTWRGSTGELEPEGDGYRFRIQIGAGRVVAGLVPHPTAMPALLSESLAASVGETFTVTLGGQQIELRQVATAVQFPSAVPNSPFLVVSAPGLLERELAVPEPGLTLNEAWSMGDASPLPALRAAGFIPGINVQSAAPIEAILAQLPQSLAVGMNFTAAAAGIGLVVIGVSASLYFAQRRRDYEFAALRAMGTERSQIRRSLMLEQGVLLGFAIVAGLSLGYLMLRLVMPYVGTSLGVSYPPPLLVIDWTSLAIALAAIVVATVTGLGLAIRTLMRSSVTGVLRGEAE